MAKGNRLKGRCKVRPVSERYRNTFKTFCAKRWERPKAQWMEDNSKMKHIA